MGEQKIDKNVLKNLPEFLLENIVDVDLSTPPEDGQVLQYDSTSGKQIPGTSSSTGSGVSVYDGGTF